MHKSHYTRDSLCHDSQVCVVCLLVTLAALVAGAMFDQWWANHSDIWSSSGLLFMWSVCSCPLSDRLACSPVLLLFPFQFVLGFLCLFSSCFGDCRFLSGFRTCASATIAQPIAVSSLSRPAHATRRLTILTVLFIHSLPCSINWFLHLLLDSEFTSWQLSGLHKRVCCRFLYVVFINYSKYYNL